MSCTPGRFLASPKPAVQEVVKAMGTITQYHGSPNKLVVPKYCGVDDRHDYGKFFYLTESIELAKEWAVCSPGIISMMQKPGNVCVNLSIQR